MNLRLGGFPAPSPSLRTPASIQHEMPSALDLHDEQGTRIPGTRLPANNQTIEIKASGVSFEGVKSKQVKLNFMTCAVKVGSCEFGEVTELDIDKATNEVPFVRERRAMSVRGSDRGRYERGEGS